MNYYIGIDLGGTNIKAGVVNENFEIVGKAKTKTLCPRPAKEIADDMAKVSIDACKDAGISIDDVQWIGIGTPGIADNTNGTIPYSNNLDFKDVPIRKYIQDHDGHIRYHRISSGNKLKEAICQNQNRNQTTIL